MTELNLEPWHDFYVMLGGSAAALVGATFVVATLAGNMEKRTIGIKGFITPATVHLGSVLIVAALLMVPTLTAFILAVLLGIGGLAGLVYGVVIYFRVTTLKVDVIDRCWYGIFPVLLYGLLGASAVLIFVKDIKYGLELIAAALVALLVTGMRNAWDMATFMIMGGPNKPEEIPDDFLMPPDDDREAEDAARRRMLIMIGVGILIAVLGGWLMFALHGYLAHEQCVVEGHRYCDGPPIEIPR